MRRSPLLLAPAGHSATDGRQLVGTNLRRLRRGRGLSQEALAELAGLHWTYVGSVERAERNVSIDNICRLAAALGVDVRELFAPLASSATTGPPAHGVKRGTRAPR